MEEYFQPNTAICCANQEEFTELCEALTSAGFTMVHTGDAPDPTRYRPESIDLIATRDAIYISQDKDYLQYTSKSYSIHEDPDHPTVVDFCDIAKKKIEISSIDELL